MSITAFERLANAIVLQAVDDYREAQRAFRDCPKDYRAKAVVTECESFFLSQRFCILTDLDGEVLLDKLRKEVR